MPGASKFLTREQGQALSRQVSSHLQFFHKLEERIQKRNWPADDVVGHAIHDARRAVQRLRFLVDTIGSANCRPDDFAHRRDADTPPPT
jgi:hypothetical protein